LVQVCRRSRLKVGCCHKKHKCTSVMAT
jgi:hypothetical protein